MENIKQKIYEMATSRGISINIENPVTIQDKINYLKCYDVTPLKTKCADKIEVHNYCKDKIGFDICVPIIKIYNTVDDINFDELPQQVVFKCNHGWNMNIIKTDDKINITETKNTLKKWLSINFGEKSGELQYSKITPKCYAEKFLGKPLTDYKFWCFNGEPKLLNIYCSHGNNYYDIDFNLLKINNILAPSDYNKKYNKPNRFDDMIKYSKILSKDFKFVRIDFYEINDTVYLGEMTFTPGNGFMKYDNKETDIYIGNMLKI